MNKIDQGFLPILGDSPIVLILGSMPSAKSLGSQQYYAHPQNAFWWIMSEMFSFDASAPYQERVDYLKYNKIAVWDVVEACHRPGSLDSAIDANSIIANDFSTLLNESSSIKLVVFNGQAAQKIFKKHVQRPNIESTELTMERFTGDYVVMPSTSPANAATKREQKLKHWRALTAYL